MSTYTMSQWSSFVTEMDGSLTDLQACLEPAVQDDYDEFYSRWESIYLWMNMVKVEADFTTSTTKVWGWSLSDYSDHMRTQVNAAFDQMKAVWDTEFNSFKNIPKFLHTRSETWSDLTPRLSTAADELRQSKTPTNWIGAGAEAYSGTLPKQLNAINDMTTMANNAATNLSQSASVMANQYAWIMASFEQLVSALEDLPGGTYVRTTNLVFWLLDLGRMLQEMATGVGQQWNADMYLPVEAMGNYAEQNQQLTEPATWPVAANLDGDFTPTAPPPGGGYQPNHTPNQPQQPVNPAHQPPGVTVPGGGPGSGPLTLDTADGHTDTGGADTTGY